MLTPLGVHPSLVGFWMPNKALYEIRTRVEIASRLKLPVFSQYAMGVMTSSGMAFALLAESHGSVEKSRAGVTRLKLFEMYLVAAKRYRVVREGLSPGFTLVEVLVAIALIGLVFSSILSA